VTLFDDYTRNLFSEIVRANALNRANMGLDYLDASMTRIGAYIIGVRAAQKSLLSALLEPNGTLRQYEDKGKLFQRLALLEKAKTCFRKPLRLLQLKKAGLWPELFPT
jgi:L-rhamnose isomerase